MEELEKLLQWLSSTLDNRVFVSLTRGLWDLTSKDVLQYAEDLNEGVPGQQVRREQQVCKVLSSSGRVGVPFSGPWWRLSSIALAESSGCSSCWCFAVPFSQRLHCAHFSSASLA